MKNTISFEKLLSQHISNVYPLIGNDFNKTNIKNCFQYTFTFSPKTYFNQKYTQLSILTTDKGIIKEITIRFHPIVDNSFYILFLKNYQKPNSIKVIDKIENTNGSILDNESSFKQNLKMRIVSTKEGGFNENPLSIIWDKVKYRILLLFEREYNISDLTFKRLKNNELQN